MGDASFNTQSFEKIFRENYSRLYYYAYDFVEDIEVSKDIVSEVFTQVWNNRSYMNQEKIVSYLYVSVRNQCLNHIKTLHKKDDYADFCMKIAEIEDDDDLMDLENHIAEMTGEIEKMPERTQYILKECYYHHKKYKEVAEELGISVDGVKKHITKALAQLRSHFNVNKTKKIVP